MILLAHLADSVEAEMPPSQLAITNSYSKLLIVLAEVALCAEVCQYQQRILCKDAAAHTLPAAVVAVTVAIGISASA